MVFQLFSASFTEGALGRDSSSKTTIDRFTYKTTFYITETSAFRNYVMYFRQDDWETLCAPLIDRLTSGTFEKVSEVRSSEVYFVDLS